ncbi:MAG: hypothetical protein MJ252_11645 [archaeon]|nr:hypothetical protein [archaeon]
MQDQRNSMAPGLKLLHPAIPLPPKIDLPRLFTQAERKPKLYVNFDLGQTRIDSELKKKLAESLFAYNDYTGKFKINREKIFKYFKKGLKAEEIQEEEKDQKQKPKNIQEAIKQNKYAGISKKYFLIYFSLH